MKTIKLVCQARHSFLLGFVILLCSKDLQTQGYEEHFHDWPVDLKINGTVFVSDAKTPSAEWMEKISVADTKPSILLLTDALGSERNEQLELLTQYAQSTDSVQIDGPLAAEVFASADCIIWMETRSANEIPQETVDRLKTLFFKHIEQGKTLCVFGPQAKMLSRFFITSIKIDQPAVLEGMNLLPDCVLHTPFANTVVEKSYLLSVLASHPRQVGIGLERNTMLMLHGRKIRVFGEGHAEFLLSANDRLPIRQQTMVQANSRKRSPDQNLIDLTEWRRDAIDRSLELFPPAEIEKPVVDSGTLMIVGGGGMPSGLMDQFIQSAGGPEQAKLVYVPCEEKDTVSPVQSMVKSWERLGVKSATMIHTKNRVQANEDDAFLEPLREATGIWFGGGRQWNLADSYYGTKAHRLMKDVLHRGGVIGGSSAGASIQASYLARATPIENFQIMAPGYERGGLGFLRGVAIDQHFTQRKRQPDMTQLVNRYPQLLGIGIDEATAIIVTGYTAKVVGRGKVYFYDRNQPVYPDRPDYLALEDGKSYDLVQRGPLEKEQR